MATTKKTTKAITKVEPKKAEVIINTSTKKSASKTSGVATADLKASHVTNVKTIDEKAKKTVILKKGTATKEAIKIEPKKAETKKAATTKAATKTTATKAATTKTTVAKTTKAATKTTTTKAATTKTTAAKTTKAATKATTTKTAAKTTKVTTTKTTAAKKTTTKKAEEITISLHVQYAGKELSQQHILDRCVENYVQAGNKKTSIKTMETYVKVEDNTVYYVVNDNYRGHVVLD